MESETESIFNDSCFDENREIDFQSDRDDDLAPKEKRVFIKMLAKLIRCACILLFISCPFQNLELRVWCFWAEEILVKNIEHKVPIY